MSPEAAEAAPQLEREQPTDYDPQPHQARFHASSALYKFFCGGVGSGKTLAGLHEFLYLAQDNPRCDGVIGVPTFPMFRDVHLPLWQDWIPRQCYTFNRSDQFFEWHPTGRRFFVRSATEPDRASGLNVGFAWLDEGGLIASQRFWHILLARLRQPAPRRCAYVTSTPPQGVNWLVRFFRTNPRAFVVRCRTKDNAHLPDDFESGLRATYGDELAALYLDALILELQGLAWPIVHRMHCRLSLDEMLARCTLRFGAVDWGHTNPAAVLVGGTDDDGRWYLFDLWYHRGRDRAEIAAEAAKRSEEFGVLQWYIDHDPEGQSQMERLGLPCTLAEKNVVSGVQHVRSLIPPRLDGEPRLYVGAWLKDWHREQEGYAFPEGEEEPVGAEGDHAMDATRYLTYTHSLTWASAAGYIGLQEGRIQRTSNRWEGT